MAAWAGTYLLSGQPLPGEFGRIGVPIALGAETALEVDDVAVLGDDAVLLVQAKGGLTLRRDPTSDIAKAVGQVVRQVINGVPTASGIRPLNPARDLLAIVSDRNSSQAVRALTGVCDRLRSLPANAPIDSAARTVAEERALACLLLHIVHEWEGATGRPPTDSQIRGVTAVLAVKALDLVEGEALAAVKVTLAGTLLDARDVERAWTEIVQAGLSLATRQRWLDRSDLVQLLTVEVGPERRLSSDIRQLREVSRYTLGVLSGHATLRVVDHELTVRRQQVDRLLADDGNCVLVGVPGSGKTGVLACLADELERAERDVIVLAIDQLGLSAGSARTELGLTFDLAAVMRGWTGAGSGTLILDGLDAVRGEASAWLRALCLSLNGTRWRVVASVREFDLRHSREWQNVFPGTPLSDESTDPDLAAVRYLQLDAFSDAELSELSAQSDHIAALLQDSPDGLLELLRVPFNLSVAADLLRSGESQQTLSSVTSEIELLNRYWQVRITDAPDGIGRRRVACRATRAMLESRRLTVDSDSLADVPDTAREALLRDGVLTESSGILRSGGRTRIGFAHHTLFDFAVAALIFAEGDQSRLMTELEIDPNLVFLARPSIDFHLAELWHATPDHRLLFEIALQFASSDHLLAGIAGGKTILVGVTDYSDLQYIFAWLERTSDFARIGMVVGWVAGAMEAAGSAELEQVRARFSAWTGLASRLDGFLSTHYDGLLAYQVARLLIQLDGVIELGHGPAEADKERAEAVSGLMALSLRDPEARGWLSENMARLLPKAVAVKPSHAAIVRELITPTLIERLPSRVYVQLVDQVTVLAKGDPEVATDLLIAVWEFTPATDGVTTLASGVLGLTSTRRQDANHVKWQVGEEFAAFIQVSGVSRASRVMAAVAKPARTYGAAKYSFAVTFGDSVGAAQRAFGILPHEPGMRAAEKVLDSLVAALPAAPLSEVTASLSTLTGSVSHPAVWRAILSAGAEHPDTLGVAMMPLLEAGGLLANPETRRAAVGLAVACATRNTSAWTELERALIRAADILDDNTDAMDTLLDQVLSVIPQSSVSDDQFRFRSAALDGLEPAEIPEPSESDEAEWENSTGVGEDDYSGLDPALQGSARRLRAALDAFRNAEGPDPQPVLAELETGIRNVSAPFEESNPLVACIVESCDALAERSALHPEDPVGIAAAELVLEVSRVAEGGRA